jgi:tetratricopeptide (TPR) repeat protein
MIMNNDCLTKKPLILTDEIKSLNYFTGRTDFIRNYLEILNNDKINNKILFVNGNGGNGKSVLLKFLYRKCSKILTQEEWEYIKELQNPQEFITNIAYAENAEDVAISLTDFSQDKYENPHPSDVLNILINIRKDLSNHGISLPIFDYACMLYLIKNGRKDEISSKLPNELADLMANIFDAINKSSTASIIKSAISLFDKHFYDKYLLLFKQLRITKEQLHEINCMDFKFEIINELPRLFAEDLNNWVKSNGKSKKIILLFDTHEAFYGYQKNFFQQFFIHGDKWLRHFLSKLDLATGILVIIAGRELPSWERVKDFKIVSNDIHSYELRGFTKAEAVQYLTNVGIEEDLAIEKITSNAEINENDISPLYLATCAEILKNDLEDSNGFKFELLKEKMTLINDDILMRLLCYVSDELYDSIRALSACRAFDWNIYCIVGGSLGFSTSPSKFNALVNFSFVDKHDNNYYSINQLIRHIFHDQSDEMTLKSHGTLYKYYEKIEDNLSMDIVDQIYHKCYLKLDQGISIWLKIFQHALLNDRIDICNELNKVLKEFNIKDNYDQGLLSFVLGMYFEKTLNYSGALQSYSNATDLLLIDLKEHKFENKLFNTGLAFYFLAKLQMSFDKKKSFRTFEKAFNCFKLLSLDFYDSNPIGIAYTCEVLKYVAELKVVEDKDFARNRYMEALVLVGGSLFDDKEGIIIHFEIIDALTNYNLLTKEDYKEIINQSNKMLRNYKTSEKLYYEELFQIYKGLGNAYYGLKDYNQAIIYYKNALVYEENCRLLEVIPVYKMIGKAYFKLEDFSQSEIFYEKVISYCNSKISKVLFYDNIYLLEKLDALNSIIRIKGLDPTIGKDKISEYIDYLLNCIEEELDLNSKFVDLYKYKASFYTLRGELEELHTNYTTAINFYHLGIDSYLKIKDKLFNLDGLYNLTRLYKAVSKNYVSLDNIRLGCSYLNKAIKLLIDLNSDYPSNINVLKELAENYKMLANLQQRRSLIQEVYIENYENALSILNEILEIEPKNIQICNQKVELTSILAQLKKNKV